MATEATIDEQAKAVAGCAAQAEHDARAAELNGLHGEQLARVQAYAATLRDAANSLKALSPNDGGQPTRQSAERTP